MDARWLGGPVGGRGRRQGTPKTSTPPPTQQKGTGEAVSGVRLFGRIDAVHQSPDGDLVELFRGAKAAAQVPIALFPSLDWVKERFGFWVALNGQAGGARVMPGPDEICRHSTDELTGQLRLICAVCEAEIGRLAPRTPQTKVRTLTRQIRELLSAHLSTDHPEIGAMFEDPWRTP